MSQPESRFNKKELLKFIAKVLISAIALYFVFKKVDFEKTWKIVLSAKLAWIAFAVVIFNLSKLISTLRVKHFLDAIGLHITHGYNILLYYIGAFYNLFLPGSISGDGYKAFLLSQRFKGRTKQLIQAVFLDRLSGMVALVVITCGLIFFTSYAPNITAVYRWVIITAAIAAFPIYYFAVALIAAPFAKAVWKTNLVSILSQLLQVGTAMAILHALSVNIHHYDYLALFMVAAVVAIFPFTIGGLGAREAVFAYGAEHLPIDEHTAIAFALLFFAVTAVSSFVGFFLSFKKDT